MAAKATCFCFRTLRTKPLSVSSSPGAGNGRGGEDEAEDCFKRAAIDGAADDAEEVELQRVARG